MRSINNKRTMRTILIGWTFILLMVSCKQGTQKTLESPNEGQIRISVEASFKPFMEEQLKVFWKAILRQRLK